MKLFTIICLQEKDKKRQVLAPKATNTTTKPTRITRSTKKLAGNFYYIQLKSFYTLKN